MCDLAWVVLSERARALALAARPAFLAAGQVPPDPEALVADMRESLEDPPERGSESPEMRRLRRLLGV